ncbi:UDP-2,4-diacetamido-2,4,6-trideoxy-beta-L-altropyranose hydrolase [Cohnella fermenti]|uniref:UDP-2,4-diacetamido-2,4, 6-trideoxy-beta-L-altropyranose hydrolase n=1 Tax=Cohnella fermenti TaxID=2565925 RepID=A0A4S4BZN0_9BACL|nr:UDP-2,4-diacetamido-2,4,6-trideoxy-beta-L-altropyranose hydrolase [Cohnella fermenti]THF80778.1 UDP-2,4-diacetamido-2,4,6-trideoxy-beta-L-altropyranose hydrolase [Cohnella fermenti]
MGVPRVVFRADASSEIGSGHTMRCLIVADRLSKEGAECFFLCKPLAGHMGGYLASRGYRVLWLAGDEPTTEASWEKDAEDCRTVLEEEGVAPDWLVIDHYGLDYRWEEAVLEGCGRPRLLVIDDLANRCHEADLLLDQNVLPNLESRYDGLVPERCVKLLGPRYLLLRPDFYEPRHRRERDGKLGRLLVFFGGSDPTEETSKALSAIECMGDDRLFHVEVIVGASNPRLASLRNRCEALHNLKLHVQVENMAERIAEADFALGAGGVAMWERCFLGLPSAVAIAADNQRDSVEEAARLGAVWNAGHHGNIDAATYTGLLRRAQASPGDLIRMAEQAQRVTRSQDAAHRSDPILEAMRNIQSE